MPTSSPKVQALVVEGDAEVATTLTERLADGLDADVHLAGTFAEATQLLAPGAYHLLVLADQLPDGSSLDLVRAARARTPDLAVVFLAPPGHEATALRAMALGAAAHVPTDGDVAAEALHAARSALARRRLVATNPAAAPAPSMAGLVAAAPSALDDGRATDAVERVLRRSDVLGAAVFAADGAPLHARLDPAVDALECGALAVRTQASLAALARLAAMEPRGAQALLDLDGRRLALGRLDEAHLGAVLVAAAAGPAAALEALVELAAAWQAP